MAKKIIHHLCLSVTLAVLIVPVSLESQQANASFDNRLMPQPDSIQVKGGNFLLTPQFSAHATNTEDARLHAAILRALVRLRNQTGIEIERTTFGAGDAASLLVEVESTGSPVQSVDEDESYHLTIADSGVVLKAKSDAGAIRGLQTMLQLVQVSGGRYVLPNVSIADAPRFAWRGLMIDCSRHFVQVDVLERTLDGMESAKLNVFHWHLVDDQGFRVESKIFPRLATAGSDGRFYTQDQVREVVAYARDRGIRVVPEFEMPGHSTALLVAYPDLSSGAAPTSIRQEFGISSYAIDPTRDETYKFLERFLGEMTSLFPDEYVHIGGDETVCPEWTSNPRILAFMKLHGLKDPAALQAYFNQRVVDILSRFHRRMVGWDEILNPDLPKDVLIQSWRGRESLAKGTGQGYRGILSAGYYLDAMQPAEQLYLVDPAPSTAAMSAEQRKLILGGEVAMWGELLDGHMIDSRVWPRTAAVAERLWSPERINDVGDMYRRLESFSIQLESFGLQHLTQEETDLRDLVGSEDTDVLKRLASVTEPLSFGARNRREKYSQDTVLNRLVDAVRPDPASRYAIQEATRRFLQNPQTDGTDYKYLEDQFKALQLAGLEAQPKMDFSPRLEGVALRLKQLSELADVALQSVTYLHDGVKPPVGWKNSAGLLIEQAKKPAASIRFVFLDSLLSLVQSVRT